MRKGWWANDMEEEKGRRRWRWEGEEGAIVNVEVEEVEKMIAAHGGGCMTGWECGVRSFTTPRRDVEFGGCK